MPPGQQAARVVQEVVAAARARAATGRTSPDRPPRRPRCTAVGVRRRAVGAEATRTARWSCARGPAHPRLTRGSRAARRSRTRSDGRRRRGATILRARSHRAGRGPPHTDRARRLGDRLHRDGRRQGLGNDRLAARRRSTRSPSAATANAPMQERGGAAEGSSSRMSRSADFPRPAPARSRSRACRSRTVPLDDSLDRAHEGQTEDRHRLRARPVEHQGRRAEEIAIGLALKHLDRDDPDSVEDESTGCGRVSKRRSRSSRRRRKWTVTGSPTVTRPVSGWTSHRCPLRPGLGFGSRRRAEAVRDKQK